MKVSRALYGASLLLGGVLLVCRANAMTFQDTVNVQFSFDTSLGITLSSRNIVISELSPGSAAYSNTITATVSTNNAYGYTLSAMVGGTGQTAANNTLYSSVTGTSFASLASDADITLANFQDNNWGYTTDNWIDNDTTYSGLIYNTGKTINKTTDYIGNPADGYVGTEYTSFTIGAKAAPTQASGDYSNVITFAVVSNAMPRPTLYEEVEAQWVSGGSRVQTNDANANTGIQAAITTANSGVFKYDASVFGSADDAPGDDYDIYYYRGILDSNLSGNNGASGFGSNGDGVTWPNYVKLGDTCWRIVRTTSSGGVKMIYNGLYSSGTTANSCANAATNAQVATQAFGLKGNSGQSTGWNRNINRVGYTFNNTQILQDSTDNERVDTVFGPDTTPIFVNNTRSNIKAYIEDTWYANNLTAYTSILETSAGYCNDRTAYSDAATSSPLDAIAPYATSNAGMYFGAYGRNLNSARTPSLSCPRNTVDLYRYVLSGSTDISNELKYPVALLTADEASFAGSGSTSGTNGSAYHANSFLRSGSNFWLLSPYSRLSSGMAMGFILSGNGYLTAYAVSDPMGVRPVTSLISGTTAVSGSGTAIDPWVVVAP